MNYNDHTAIHQIAEFMSLTHRCLYLIVLISIMERQAFSKQNSNFVRKLNQV